MSGTSRNLVRASKSLTWLVRGTSTLLIAELQPQKHEFQQNWNLSPSHIKANFHLDKMSVNTPINFFILWPFYLFPWALYVMTKDSGLNNICRSIVNYTTINIDTNGIRLKVTCYMSFIFSSFINGVEPNFLDKHNLHFGPPKSLWWLSKGQVDYKIFLLLCE